MRENWLKRLIAKIRPPVPHPAPGQVWRSSTNGDIGRVSDVRVDRTGWVFVSMEWWRPDHHGGHSWGIGDSYACGIGQWQRAIRSEKMEQIGHSDLKDIRTIPPTGGTHA